MNEAVEDTNRENCSRLNIRIPSASNEKAYVHVNTDAEKN